MPEAPLIREMPTRPKVFLAMPDARRLRSYNRTHIKKGLVPYLSGGGTENKYWKCFESWQRMTRDELGCRTAGEDCWGRKRNIYQEIRTADNCIWWWDREQILKVFWVLATHDKRRAWVQDCWRRLLRKEKEYLPRDSYCRQLYMVVGQRTNTESVLSLGNAWQETSLGAGLLEKIVEEGKGIFTKRFVLQTTVYEKLYQAWTENHWNLQNLKKKLIPHVLFVAEEA